MRGFGPFLIAALLGAAANAQAAITISDKPTRNVSCSGGVCAPTARQAVLNAGDLVNMLGEGDVTVASNGTAPDIVFGTNLVWAGNSGLTLDAFRAVVFEQPLILEGTFSHLTLTVDDGGSGGDLRFAGAGRIEIAGGSSVLTINGNPYTLARDFDSFRKLLNGGRRFVALMADVAAGGRTFHAPPVASYTVDGGIVEGLGNAVTGLKIDDRQPALPTGLIGELGTGATVRDLAVVSADIRTHGVEKPVGVLIGESEGSIIGCSASGQGVVSGAVGYAGGLLARNDGGSVVRSHASTNIRVRARGIVEGGLVGFSTGPVDQSFATGTMTGASDTLMGGLVGINQNAAISNAYATGDVLGGADATTGGLVGFNAFTVSPTSIVSSYSTGAVTGDTAHDLSGGLIGEDSSQAKNAHAYWDLDTSGFSDPSMGAGNISDDPGITGLTSTQFQSGLPKGFDKSVWAESPSINGGFPYLIAVPAD